MNNLGGIGNAHQLSQHQSTPSTHSTVLRFLDDMHAEPNIIALLVHITETWTFFRETLRLEITFFRVAHLVLLAFVSNVESHFSVRLRIVTLVDEMRECWTRSHSGRLKKALDRTFAHCPPHDVHLSRSLPSQFVGLFGLLSQNLPTRLLFFGHTFRQLCTLLELFELVTGRTRRTRLLLQLLDFFLERIQQLILVNFGRRSRLQFDA